MITIYKPEGVTVDVRTGNPPVDQLAEVAVLQQQVAQLQAQVSDLSTANAVLSADNASLRSRITVGKSHVDAAAAAPQHLQSAQEALTLP